VQRGGEQRSVAVRSDVWRCAASLKLYVLPFDSNDLEPTVGAAAFRSEPTDAANDARSPEMMLEDLRRDDVVDDRERRDAVSRSGD
jgi:hypothetical protein